MDRTLSAWRAAGLAALLAGVLSATGAMANSAISTPFVKSALVQVDVYDRFDRSALPVFSKDGRNYIVGVPGHEYAVRIRNCTGARVLVVTSVDGVNVISGDTASPAQSGYVLEPWASVEITGWRKSLQRTAAFYFTDLGDSYAARTGRPQNVGVIGVAVFQEKPPRISWRENAFARKQALAEAEADATSGEGRRAPDASGTPGRHSASNEATPTESQAAASSPPLPASSPPLPLRDRMAAADESVRQERKDESAKLLGKIGTGHGRSEESRATTTHFERASASPSETVVLQYDRRENLVALGVLPEPRPRIARRQPDPFPGAMRFAPDPRW